MNQSLPMIELDGVSKSFGDKHAVAGLDLRIPRGSTYGLLGPNGAGKTTTIRMLLQILEPDAGEIRIAGEPVTRDILDRVGYLPEERGVYKRMQVGRLLSFFAETKGVKPADSKPRIREWLEKLDLIDRIDARVQELSQGMQQKLQFIGSILHAPDILILDEPFSGLDVINQQVLKDIVLDLKRREKTIVFCTHMIDQAERVCDHVCILARGEKVVDGRIADVKREHGGMHVRVGFEEWNAEAVNTVRRAAQVESLHEHGHELEVTLRQGSTPHQLLEHLMQQRVRLGTFSRIEPSLERIFIQRVGATPEEMAAQYARSAEEKENERMRAATKPRRSLWRRG
ncbi:MAG TPA: ATP-binding cassette domain-containing protein [Longimicrobiales bacterium]|nr:ATP-binding cassette domain-containing protein [Longimicrobiales bacterium]